MATKRIFLGLNIPDDITTSLQALVDPKDYPGHWRWHPSSNWHITLHFLGQQSEVKITELQNVLSQTHLPSCNIELDRLDLFPPQKPHTFVAYVHLTQDLAILHHQVATILQNCHLAMEQRPYLPHLSLAKIKMPPCHIRITALPLSFKAEKLTLYHSRPGPKHSIYEPLAEFPLNRPM